MYLLHNNAFQAVPKGLTFFFGGGTSEAMELGVGGGGAFVFGFAWMEAVGDVESDPGAVVALMLVYGDAVGVHGPVVVGGVEDVGG